MNNPGQPAPTPPGADRGDCSSLALFLFAWLVVLITAFGQVTAGIVMTLFEAPALRFAPFLMALGQSLLLLLLLAAPAARWNNPFYRSIFRSWMAAEAFVGAASFIHFTPPYETHLRAVLQIAAAAVYLLAAWLFAGRPTPNSGSAPSGRVWLLALAAAALFAYPWLAWGAFGSATDTFLQLLAALFLGLAAAFTLEFFLFPIFSTFLLADSSPDRGASRLRLAGLAAGNVLLLLSSGMAFGYHVMQVLLMLALPSLGFVLAGLAQLSSIRIRQGAVRPRFQQARVLPLAVLVGLAAAAPMTLLDPTELYLVASLSPGEILQWALSAAFLSGFLALLAGSLLLGWVRRQSAPAGLPPAATGAAVYSSSPTNPRSPAWLFLAAALSVVGAVLVYFVFGQPGAYGDTLFVIITDQRDVSAAAQIEDLPTRREFVYRELVNHAQSSQAELRAVLERFNLRYTPYYLVNGLEVEGGPLLRLWLLSRPEVDRVLRNPRMRPLPARPPVSTGSQAAPQAALWNLELIRAPQAWQEFEATGEGIVIGQSDSGVEWQHPELAHSYRGWSGEGVQPEHSYNWFDPWYGSQEPADISGHGTHTLGSVLGQQTGVAPGATWFGCANLARNLGNPALYLDCMQFMLAPFPQNGDPFQDGDPALGADILNNSWSCPAVEGCDPASLLPAVRALRAAGIFVVVSAGNDGPACASLKQPPAIYAEVLSVGAVDSRGSLALFSSLGPVNADGSQRVKPDLVAPGQEVLSAMPGGTYGSLSGTSMAGPHAAGVAALIWSANPALKGDIERTQQILLESTQPYSGLLPQCPGADSTPSTAVGYGLIDAYEAVRAAVEGE